MDRLDLERAVIRTEWNGRSRSATDRLPLWRYGARGFGLTSYPEYGLPMLRPDDLREWVARYFTRENAVLWIAGDGPPPGLRLRLPAGKRQPVPAASTALPASPAYFAGPESVVALDAVVPRSVSVVVYAGILQRALFRALRQESGLSYSVNVDHESRGDGLTTVLAAADALPEKRDAALGEFLDVVAALRVGRIDGSDLDTVVAQGIESLDRAETPAGRLPGLAVDLLTDAACLTTDELREEVRSVTLEDVHAVARQAASTALLMVPTGLRATWAGYAPAPAVSEAAVTGHSHTSRSGGAVKLIIGADGVSLSDTQNALTVRYDDCAALRIWPDGGRRLVGNDGIEVSVEPTLYRVDQAALQSIDAGVPSHLHIVEPARSPDEVPQPRPVGQPRRLPREWLHGFPLVALLHLLAIAVLLVVLVITIGDILGDDRGLEGVLGAMLGAALGGYLLHVASRRVQQLREFARLRRK